MTKEGFQPSGINEGVIYGGIFQENSAAGCVSLSAAGAVGAVTASGQTNVTGVAAGKNVTAVVDGCS